MGAKPGPRAKARGAPPPPPRSTKPRGNPEGFKAAAEEAKANLDPWGMPIKKESPSGDSGDQPARVGGEMTMAE